MILRFKKLKFVNGLFYKNSPSTVELVDGLIKVNTHGYYGHCWNYTIIQKYSEDFEKEVFIAVKNIPSYNVLLDEGLELAKRLRIINTIKIYKSMRKFIVFDEDYNGVILKN